MKRSLAALLAFFAAAAIAAVCGSGSAPDASPTPAPAPIETPATAAPSPTVVSPPPAASPTPAPVLHTSGWAVYTRGADLYLGSLDGTTERPLTEGAAQLCGNASGGCRTLSSYAGSATVDGRRWLYYTKALGLLETQEYAMPTIKFVLARRPFDGGPEEGLAWFDAFTTSSAHASTSPDGLHVAYGAVDGLRRFDLATRDDVLLLPSVTDCTRIGSPGGRCRIYSDPRWSPAGAPLLVREGYAEGARPLLIDPMTALPENPTRLDVGGRFAVWHPDGTRICMSEDGYDGGPGGIYARDSGAFGDLTGRLGTPPVLALDCAWNADGGRVVFSYRRASNTAGVAVFSRDGGGAERDIAVGPEDGLLIGGWLPDGSGIVATWSVGEERPHSWIQMLGGTTRTLAVAADQVQAVLP